MKEKPKKTLFQCTLVPNTVEGYVMARSGVVPEKRAFRWAYSAKQAHILLSKAHPDMEVTQVQIAKKGEDNGNILRLF
jgi:hypothetical protein